VIYKPPCPAQTEADPVPLGPAAFTLIVFVPSTIFCAGNWGVYLERGNKYIGGT
jgi:hypothetical protein